MFTAWVDTEMSAGVSGRTGAMTMSVKVDVDVYADADGNGDGWDDDDVAAATFSLPCKTLKFDSF